MRPKFRSDLEAAREEQQGVVFYRIDDPQTQTSFRLYEIEFLIAKKLDGSRSLDEVISAVKAEYNFDISGPDLKKFVSQLESMGFIRSDEGSAAELAAEDQALADATGPMLRDSTAIMALPSAEPVASPEGREDSVDQAEVSTAVMPRPTAEALASASDPAVEEIEIIGDADEVTSLDDADIEPRRVTGNPEEIRRMIKTAVGHLEQGYVVHARDYFLAASESSPQNEKIANMVSELEQAGEEPDAATLEGLLALGNELLAGDFEPVVDGLASGDDLIAEEPLRHRMMWVAILALIILGGAVGLFFVIQETRIFESAAEVNVVALKAERQPAFFPAPATEVAPMREEWIVIGSKGKIAELAEVGERVEEGAVLVSLGLSPKIQKKLDKAAAAVDKAQERYNKQAAALDKVLQERQKIEAERDGVEEQIKGLQPDGVLSGGGDTRKEVDRLKKLVVKANKKLSKLAKKERRPRGQVKKAQKRIETARKRLAAMEKKLGGKRSSAPYPGVVVETKVEVGQSVKPDTQALLFRDASGARVRFTVADPGDLQTGGEAHVAIGNKQAEPAKVLSLNEAEGGAQLEVHIAETEGSLEMKPEAFRLVREFVDTAFGIDATALVDGSDDEEGKVFVYIAIAERAVRREVNVLWRDTDRAVVQPADGPLRSGDRIVVSYPGEGGVAALLDDMPLVAREKR